LHYPATTKTKRREYYLLGEWKLYCFDQANRRFSK
jgi:hypothetical protein